MPKPQSPSRKDIKKLEEIEYLMRQHQYQEALEELIALTTRRSRLVEAWDLLIEVAGQLNNTFVIWKACDVMREFEPDEHAYVHNLIYASAQLNYTFLTKYFADMYLRDFPDTSEREKIAELNAKVTAGLPQIRATANIPDSVTIDDLYYHEKAQLLITHGDVIEGRKLVKKAIHTLPEMAAPRNNLALSYTVTGDFDKALKITDQTLQEFPNNLFALCGQVQYLIRLNRHDDAEPFIEILEDKEADNPDYWLKLVETLAYTNDTELVKAKYDQAIDNIENRNYIIPPLLYHFGAVAYARSGDPKTAKKLWKKVQKLDPSLGLARDNLRDLNQKPGDQVGAWYFKFSQLLVRSWIERLARAAERADKKGERAYKKDIERVFRANPALKHSIPIMLKLGDAVCIDFVLNLAAVYPIPELADFALGTHGKDKQRMEAGNIAVDQGFLEANTPIDMYQDGEYRPMMLWNFEIYEEPTEWDGDEDVQELYETAYYQMLDGDYEDALATIDEALAIEPNKREALNLRVSTLTVLNRDDEADALTHELAEKHPDYFFARISMARMLVRQDKLDEVEQWLTPLREKTRFHISEFKSFAVTEVEYLFAQDQRDAAITWIQMWNGVDPDSVPLQYKAMLGMSNLFKK